MIANTEDLIEFLVRYHAPALQADPPRPVELPDFPIPDCLRLIYSTFGHHSCSGGLFDAQDTLYDPGELRPDEAGQVCFVNENQSCWTSAYDQAAPGNPVTVYTDSPDGEPACERLEDFLITFALQEAVMGSPRFQAIEHSGLRPASFKLDLQDLHRNGCYAWPAPSHDFWTTPEHDLLCMHTTDWYWLGSYAEDLEDRFPSEIKFESPCKNDSQNAPAPGSLREKFLRWFS